MPVIDPSVTIKPLQTIDTGKPVKTLMVFNHRIDLVGRKSVFFSVPSKNNFTGLGNCHYQLY
jgi:hypothetical protein